MPVKPDKLQDLQLFFETAAQVLICCPAQRCKETVDNLTV
jgi:hypothetical protein